MRLPDFFFLVLPPPFFGGGLAFFLLGAGLGLGPLPPAGGSGLGLLPAARGGLPAAVTAGRGLLAVPPPAPAALTVTSRCMPPPKQWLMKVHMNCTVEDT